MENKTNVPELIKALEVCISSNKGCSKCPYNEFCGYDDFSLRARCLKALKLLQELSNTQDSKIHMLENFFNRF